MGIIAAFFYGTIWGSFCNVLIYRLPLNQDWIFARSKCTECNKLVSWWMNIPLFSYLILKGKCFNCHKKISIQYPIVELICGLKAILLYWAYVHEINSATILNFLFHDMILTLLIAHFIIDLKYHLLPDIITIMLLVLILINVGVHESWYWSLTGAAIGFFSTLIITYIFYLMKGQIGLGGGDIKLYGVIGLMVGPMGIVQTLLVSSIIGIFHAITLMCLKKMKKDQPFAFGPSIIITFILQIHFPFLMQKFF